MNRNRTTGEDRIVGTSREVPVHRADGTVVWGALSLSRVELDDGRKLYTAFLKDIKAERDQRVIIDQTLEQALDAVVTIDESNTITFFNAAAERLWGYHRDQVLGQNVKMLVPPDIQGGHDGFVNRNRTTGEDRIVGTSREVPVHRAHGTVVWGALSLSRDELDDGRKLYTAFLKDITAERDQRAKFEVLSLVADETDNSVIICDGDRRIEYVKPGFEKLTGYTAAEVVGRSPGSFLQRPLTDPDTVERIRGHLDRAEPFYEEILNYTKDGEPYWISLAINPVLGDDGRLERFVSIQANATSTRSEAQAFAVRLEAIGSTGAVADLDGEGVTGTLNAFMTERRASAEVSLQDLLGDDQIATISSGTPVAQRVRWPDGDEQLVLDAVFAGVMSVEGLLEEVVMFGIDVAARAGHRPCRRGDVGIQRSHPDVPARHRGHRRPDQPVGPQRCDRGGARR